MNGKLKITLTWGGGSLCTMAIFPPHLSHADSQLSNFLPCHQFPAPLPPFLPLPHSLAQTTYCLLQQKDFIILELIF